MPIMTWLRANRIVVIGVAFCVALAAAAGARFYYSTLGSGNATSGPQPDGPTMYQALSAVNASIRDVSGGPWALFSVWGVAAQSPFSPNVVGYPSENDTVNSCGQEFNGLTLWNGTMPVFHGTFDSGTAPFWQFAFFSNTTEDILLATDVLGTPHVFPPMTYPWPCNAWYDLGTDASRWTIPPGTFPVDSPAAVQVALDHVDQNRLARNAPEVELITVGPGIFDGFGDVSGYGVFFDRCGLVGVAGGAEPLVLVGESAQGQWGETENLTHGCALPVSGYGALDATYDMMFSPATVVNGSSTAQATVPFQVAIALPNGTLTNDDDAWGLANWMASLNLTTPTGQNLPLGVSACRSWVASTAECTADPTGWYALLLSSNGEWLNSYGVSPNGTAWSVPVDALVSHQQLLIVCPSSWNLSGDSLSVTSTVLTSKVVGSISL
ncbi:MAG: hypothetical protein ABSB97_00240 [Thermoplasmata archaeon]|jgi:hypothetical protein